MITFSDLITGGEVHEPAIGEDIALVRDIRLHCMEGGTCRKCALFGSGACEYIRCTSHTRADGRSVTFTVLQGPEEDAPAGEGTVDELAGVIRRRKDRASVKLGKEAEELLPGIIKEVRAQPADVSKLQIRPDKPMGVLRALKVKLQEAGCFVEICQDGEMLLSW